MGASVSEQTSLFEPEVLPRKMFHWCQWYLCCVDYDALRAGVIPELEVIGLNAERRQLLVIPAFYPEDPWERMEWPNAIEGGWYFAIMRGVQVLPFNARYSGRIEVPSFHAEGYGRTILPNGRRLDS